MVRRSYAQGDDPREKKDGHEKIKREGIAPQQIEAKPREYRADRIGGKIERVRQAVDAAERTPAEKIRPDNGKHRIPATVKNAVQRRQQKYDPDPEWAVDFEQDRPIQRQKQNPVPDDVRRQEVLDAEPFGQSAPQRRPHHPGKGNGTENQDGGRLAEPLIGQKGIEMEIDARLLKGDQAADQGQRPERTGARCLCPGPDRLCTITGSVNPGFLLQLLPRLLSVGKA